jgi:hypothetical protein
VNYAVISDEKVQQALCAGDTSWLQPQAVAIPTARAAQKLQTITRSKGQQAAAKALLCSLPTQLNTYCLCSGLKGRGGVTFLR